MNGNSFRRWFLLMVFLLLPGGASSAAASTPDGPVPLPMFDEVCWICNWDSQTGIFMYPTLGNIFCDDEEEIAENQDCEMKDPEYDPGTMYFGPGCPGDTCAPEEEEEVPELLVLAIDRGDIPVILRELEARPERVWLNADRNAVQLAGCGGTVVGHIPISSALSEAIQDRLQ